VASARAAQLGLPFVDLTDYPIDQSAVSLVPVALLRRHEVLPIGRDGDRLLLAMADPRDVLALDDIRAAVKMQARPVVAERNDLMAALDRFVRSDSELSELTVAMVEENTSSDLVPVADQAETTRPSCAS
jgi:Type II secretory pathway, ATPase PulE/Tfp pilus assembly pathway, ATPase PilB